MNEETVSICDKIKVLRWPFRRFEVLLPKHVESDSLEWLFLSLVVYSNKTHKREPNQYSEYAVNEAMRTISQYFGSVITPQIVKKIDVNIKRQYITEKGLINAKALESLNTYDAILSKDCEVRYLFQDLITGDVLPCFYTNVEFANKGIRDRGTKDVGENTLVLKYGRVDRPNDNQIRRAYHDYYNLDRIDKYKGTTLSNHIEFDDELNTDEYQQANNGDPNTEDTEKSDNSKELRSIKRYSIIFIDGGKGVDYHLDIDIGIVDGEISLSTPFENYTKSRIISYFNQGLEFNTQLKELKKSLEKSKSSSNRKERSFEEYEKDGAYSGLKHCRTLLDLVSSYNSDKIIGYVLDLDEYFDNKVTRDFFYTCAYIMEAVLKLKKYQKMGKEERQKVSLVAYKKIIREVIEEKGVACGSLSDKAVYQKWVEKYDYNPEGSNHFKSDLADFIIGSKIMDSRLMRHDSITDIISLYNRRNSVSHDNDKKQKLPTEADIRKLEEIIELFNEVE